MSIRTLDLADYVQFNSIDEIAGHCYITTNRAEVKHLAMLIVNGHPELIQQLKDARIEELKDPVGVILDTYGIQYAE